jgi:hypothetical protein
MNIRLFLLSIILLMFDGHHKLWSFHLCSFLKCRVTSSVLGPDALRSFPFSTNFDLCSYALRKNALTYTCTKQLIVLRFNIILQYLHYNVIDGRQTRAHIKLISHVVVDIRNVHKIFDRAYQIIEVIGRISKSVEVPCIGAILSAQWWTFATKFKVKWWMLIFRIGEIPHSGSAVRVIQTIHGTLLPIGWSPLSPIISHIITLTIDVTLKGKGVRVLMKPCKGVGLYLHSFLSSAQNRG